MTINGYAHHDGDLDVPEWMKPLDGATKPPQTIRGEVIEQPTIDLTKGPADPDDDEDDLAPGMIEYVPYRRPVLTRTGSAAVVAAGATGRGGWAVTRWLCHGLAASTILGWRYVRAHDHIESLGGMDGPKWAKVHQTRHQRWGFLGKLAGGLTLADLLAWWGLDQGAGFGTLGALSTAPTVEAIAAGAALTLYGRYRLNAKLGPTEIVAAEDIDDGDEPFPLAWCKDGAQVAECVSRALAYEGIDTRRIDVLGNRAWGWEVDVVLKGSTPGKVNAVADQLDAHFNIKTGGTLIDPDPQQSAHIVLRLVTANPFAAMVKPTPHAPKSLDIADAHHFGMCMDGNPLNFVLEGTRILVIGVSGSAKTTGVLRDLAEVITACHNAIALDMDPVKDGLREFEGVMAAPPIRGSKACETWLEHLVKMAKARNTVRNRMKMGDTWAATATHPAIFPFVDEFIYLSQKGKELFIELLRIGKQSGIFPIAAGQDATSDSLGDAIADSFTLSVMLASRFDDIRLVFGAGAGAQGYRPDRLTPAQNKDIRNDAGQSYIKGAGINRPLLYGWNEHSRAGIERAVEERRAAGRPWFDHDTLAAAGLLHLADGNATAVDGARIVPDCITVMADARVDRMRTERLVEGLKDHDLDAYGDLTADQLRELLRNGGAGSPVALGALDGMANPRGYKLDALTAIG
jgi:hypothetical protein